MKCVGLTPTLVAHKAFKMFTDNQLLESWLTNVADVEPIVGGKYELFWEPENREDNSTFAAGSLQLNQISFYHLSGAAPNSISISPTMLTH